MSPQLELLLDTETGAPGDTVHGTVVVVEGGKSRSLTASLEYHESSEDFHRVARTVSVVTLHDGELVAGSRFPFALVLPADALPDYKSAHGELAWKVHAESDELGRDTHVRHRVAVSLRA